MNKPVDPMSLSPFDDPKIKWVPWFVLILWVGAGVAFVVLYRPFGMFFPIVGLIWLLIGLSSIGAFMWRRWAVVWVPVISVVLCFPLTFAYWSFENWEAEYALNEFIVSAVQHRLPDKFDVTIYAAGRDYSDFSAAYTVEAEDFFFGVWEWRVRFENGSHVCLSMNQIGPDKWHVSVSGCPAR